LDVCDIYRLLERTKVLSSPAGRASEMNFIAQLGSPLENARARVRAREESLLLRRCSTFHRVIFLSAKNRLGDDDHDSAASWLGKSLRKYLSSAWPGAR